MAGIVSWGLECGKKDVPGVYADITEGLCFIDYATKCIHGKKYQQFYDYPQCTNWLEDLIGKYVSNCQTFIFYDLLNYLLLNKYYLSPYYFFSGWNPLIMELMLLKGVLKKQEISVKHVMDLFLGILHLDRKKYDMNVQVIRAVG